jgi:uncharacterized membrane protein
MEHRFKYILLISLALNLLLIGVVLGYFLRGPEFKARPFPPPITQKLSSEKQWVFDEAMRELAEKNKVIARDLERKRSEILSVLTAERFDAQVFQQKSREVHELHGQMKAQLDGVLEQLASEFNREERRALAELLRRGPPPPHGGPPPGPHRPGPFPGFNRH